MIQLAISRRVVAPTKLHQPVGAATRREKLK